MAENPDDKIVALFKPHTIPNPSKTATAGRPMFDDMEVCELRFAGSRSVSVFPATAISHWRDDPQTGEQTPVTYAERFARQYRQFKEAGAQTMAGTPLAYATFLTEARRAELRALNIYTVEALAHVDGQELKNLGSGGRDMKNLALEFISNAKVAAPSAALQAEIEALRARNEVLEDDAKRRAETKELGDSDSFDQMSLEQLREYITTTSGRAPHGSIGRKTLARMAADLKSPVA